MKTEINWSRASMQDYELAKKIVERTSNIKGFGKVDFMSLQMDIVATHISGCKLRLQELLEAELSDFAHDICGIIHHIDRGNGKLKNCFVPRYAC